MVTPTHHQSQISIFSLPEYHHQWYHYRHQIITLTSPPSSSSASPLSSWWAGPSRRVVAPTHHQRRVSLPPRRSSRCTVRPYVTKYLSWCHQMYLSWDVTKCTSPDPFDIAKKKLAPTRNLCQSQHVNVIRHVNVSKETTTHFYLIFPHFDLLPCTTQQPLMSSKTQHFWVEFPIACHSFGCFQLIIT